VHAAVLGTLVSVGSALVPLAGIRRVKPLSLLRDETEGTGASRRGGCGRGSTPSRRWPGVVRLGLGSRASPAWQAGLVAGGRVRAPGRLRQSVGRSPSSAPGAAFVRLVQPQGRRVPVVPARHAG
jgi:hypothetical protein